MAQKSSLEEVVVKFKIIHGDRYLYDKVIYTNAHTKVIITCREHGDFLMSPSNHMGNHGCSKCHTGKDKKGVGRKYDCEVGDKFGKLLVKEKLYHIFSGREYYSAICDCDCGSTNIYVKMFSLLSGKTNSCGCLNKEAIKISNKRFNTFNMSGENGIGYTSTGKEFYFDKEDYDKIKDFCWSVDKNGYVHSSLNRKRFYMHRFLLNAPKNKVVDHIDHITINNQKKNLRVCEHKENVRNGQLSKNNTSGITGVRYDERIKLWTARIKVDYKIINLGDYYTKEEANKIRKEAEIKYFGEFRYKADKEAKS